MEQSELRALMAQILSSPPSARLLDRIATAGSPLVVEQLLSAADQEGLLVRTADGVDLADDAPLEGLRQAIMRKVGQLPPPGPVVVDAYALLQHGRGRAAASDVAAVTHLTVGAVAEGVASAAAAGLLVPGQAGVRFVHQEVMDAVYTGTPWDVRAAQHREAAQQLQATGAPSGEVVAQLSAGARPGELETGEAIVRAARSEQCSLARSVDLYGHAARAFDGYPELQAEALADRVIALARIGQVSLAASESTALVGRPDRLGDRVRAALALGLLWQGRAAEASALLPLDERTEATADVAATVAFAYLLRGEVNRAVAASTRLLKDPDLVGSSRCLALSAGAWSHALAGWTATSIALADEATGIARDSPEARSVARPALFLGFALTLADRFDEAVNVLAEGRHAAELDGNGWHEPHFLGYLANAHLHAGRWDDASAEDEAALLLVDRLGLELRLPFAFVARKAYIATHRGELEEATRVLSGSGGSASGALGAGIAALPAALVHEQAGRPDLAVALLQEQWTHNVEQGLLIELRLLGPVLARLLVATGRRPAIAALLGPLDELAERSGVASAQAAALRVRALLDRDAADIRPALALYEQSGRPAELAATLEDESSLLRPRDARAAAASSGRAREIWRSLGAHGDLARLDAEHPSRRTPSPQPRPRYGWEALTPAERAVVAKVAEGLSNAQVAQAMSLSRYTVETHLKRVFRKLDVSTRQQLVVASLRPMSTGL